jgi:lipoprotein NlpI
MLRGSQGNWKSALDDVDKGMAILGPRAGAMHYGVRGEIKGRLRDFDGAIADFTACLERDPKMPRVYYLRATARSAKDDERGALADVELELAGNPDDVAARTLRARLRWSARDLDGAMADYDRAIELAPKRADLRRRRAAIRYETGGWQAAWEDYDAAVALESKPEDYARFFRLIVARKLGRDTRLDEFSREVETWNEGWPRAIGRFLAGRLEEKDFLAKAEEAQGTVLNERRCEAFYYVAVMHQHQGDGEGARVFWQKCVATKVRSFTEFSFAQAELANEPGQQR